MRANGLPSTNRGYMKCDAQRSASALVLALVMLASCGADSSDAAVSRDLHGFFEAFVGRDLSAGELENVTKEFVELHSPRGSGQ